MPIAHRLPARTAARPRPSSAPASIPTPPPGPLEQTRIFCQDLPPPRTSNRSAPSRNRHLRRRATRTISARWAAYKLASTIVTSAMLLFLVGLAVYKHAPVAKPPQSPVGHHSPYPPLASPPGRVPPRPVGPPLHKHAPVAKPPQSPVGHHSPYPHPGSPFAVVEFK